MLVDATVAGGGDRADCDWGTGLKQLEDAHLDDGVACRLQSTTASRTVIRKCCLSVKLEHQQERNWVGAQVLRGPGVN